MNTKEFVALIMLALPSLFAGYWFTREWPTGRMLHFRNSIQDFRIFSNNSVKNKPRFMIYQCRNGQECGGLADRQKGIVTTFVLSQIVNATFGIDMDKPCAITRYLIPNHVNWVIPPDILRGKTKTTWYRIGRQKNDLDLRLESVPSMVKSDVTFFKGNMDLVPILMQNPLYKQLPWTKNLTHHDVYKYVYDQLFTLSNSTQAKLDDFLKKVGKSKLFCSHVRIGRSSTMPRDVPRPKTAANPDVVIDFLTNKVANETSYKIFLATDSSAVKEKFRSSFGSNLTSIEGPIIHVNLAAANQRCEGMEKALLDQKVLSLCDVLVQSYSGFSRLAALLRGSDEDLYEAVKNRVTKITRLDPSFAQKLR